MPFLDKQMKLSIRAHIIFWIAVILLLTGIFGKVFESFALSFYFVSMLLPIAVGTSYVFNSWLVPRYLFKKRYKKFSLYFFYLLIISTWLEMWVITGAFILLANYNFNNLGPVAGNVLILAIILYFIVFLKGFLLLVKHSFRVRNKSKSLEAEKRKFQKGYITVRADRQQAKILYEDILYIESMGDYVKVNTLSGDSVMTRERISHIDKELPETFLRIHRSFIVNSQKVGYFSKTELEVNGSTLPISRTYKKDVNERLSKNSA